MSSEEEAYYLSRYQDGDMDAKNILVEKNLRLVAHIVKKYAGSGRDTDELIAIGIVGLVKAVNTFKADKGSRLGTYAARCIDNELLMMLRTERKLNREISLYEPIGTDKEGNEISLLDVLFTESESIFDQVDFGIEIKKLYEKIGRVLKPREKLILRMRYGLDNTEEKTQREIAEQMGISRSYVSRIEKKALKKLYQELSKS